MPAPASAAYSAAATLAAVIAAHTALRDLLDAGTGPAQLRVRSAADALLATITLGDPAGTINGTTGQLALSIAASGTWSADGAAAYGELCDSAGVVHLSLPAAAGGAASAGYLVINSLTAVTGGEFSIVSATIG